jgi:hypothetical protein
MRYRLGPDLQVQTTYMNSVKHQRMWTGTTLGVVLPVVGDREKEILASWADTN